jgi:hypothetical protein
MADSKSHREQFDRFAQDAYLQELLQSDPDAVIPTLFLDLMNRVNMMQGQTGLILAEVEQADESGHPPNLAHITASSVHLMEGAVDMSNILKALMEYYELTYKAQGDAEDAEET